MLTPRTRSTVSMTVALVAVSLVALSTLSAAPTQENESLSIEIKNSLRTEIKVFSLGKANEGELKLTIPAGKSDQLVCRQGTTWIVRGPQGAELYRFQASRKTKPIVVDRDLVRSASTEKNKEPKPNPADDSNQPKQPERNDAAPNTLPINPSVDLSGKWIERIAQGPFHRDLASGSVQSPMDAPEIHKPNTIDVVRLEDGIQVTRDAKTSIYKPVGKGLSYKHESSEEMVLVRGDELVISNKEMKEVDHFERFVEPTPIDLVGLWISDAPKTVDYFRIHLDGERLVCTRNDFDLPMTIENFSTSGFQMSKNSEVIASYEFYGARSFRTQGWHMSIHSSTAWSVAA